MNSSSSGHTGEVVEGVSNAVSRVGIWVKVID